MPCTTILIGKKASYDGSTIVARNEDSGNGSFESKRLVVVAPEDQPRHYRSVISHVQIDLPDNPQRYTAVPNANLSQGIWGEAGFNESQVAMSATETLTTNERVLGADPLVECIPASGVEGEEDYQPEVAGGIGEEDFLTIVLPYIHTAREGVARLGELLERYGTYEMNGTAFSDADEIWWMETVGGHHWIARRVPDEAYVTMPNQLGIDEFDLDDAFGEQRDCMCSADLREWMAANHLDLTLSDADLGLDTCEAATAATDGVHVCFNPREAFGSHSERDHVYNTCRAWAMQRALNPSDFWDGPDADYTPESDDIPWCRVPERRLTIEDVKDVLSNHYEGTPFDPYGSKGSSADAHRFRPIGINRNCQLAVLQIRPYAPAACRCVQWMAMGSNAFNTLAPFYGLVSDMPAYLRDTTDHVTTDSFYWANRIVAAVADPHFGDNINTIDNYRERTMAYGHRVLRETDAEVAALPEGDDVTLVLEAANERIATELREQTDKLLSKVLYTSSMLMRNGFSLSDH